MNRMPPLDLGRGGAVWGGPSDTHKAVRQILKSTFLENYWSIKFAPPPQSKELEKSYTMKPTTIFIDKL